MKNLFEEKCGNNTYDLFAEDSDGVRYGISVISAEESAVIRDITTIYEKAYDIYETLIRNYVSPLHAECIITDLIS